MFHTNRYMRLPYYCPENQEVTIVKDDISQSDFIEKILKATKNRDDWDESFFVTDVGVLLEKQLLWKKLLPNIKPYYAVKCNCLQPVIATLAALGLGFDCASRVEINQLLGYGTNPSDIIYDHTHKFVTHVEYAKENGVDLMAFDDEEELLKIKEHHAKAKLLLRIRVQNSNKKSFSEKFGATSETAKQLLKRTRELSLDIQGISFHLGTIRDIEEYEHAISAAKQLFVFAKEEGITLNILNIGGGYTPVDVPRYQFTKAAEVISSAIKEHFSKEFSHVQIIAEPGTYCVSEAISLMTNVIGKRVNKGEKSYFCGDGIYGCFNKVLCRKEDLHPTAIFKNGKKTDGQETKEKVKLFGPSLDGDDVINHEAMIADVDVGDWLLWKNLGEYTPHFAFGFNGIVTQKAFYFITESNLKRLLENCENPLQLPLMHKDYSEK